MSNLELVTYLGAAQCFMLGSLLWRAQVSQNYSNRILASLIVLVGYFLLVTALAASAANPWLVVPASTGLTIFATGPLLWFFVRSLCEPDFRFWPAYRIHLLPAVLAPPLVAIYAVIWITPNVSTAWPSDVVDAHSAKALRSGISLLLALSLLSYGLAARTTIQKHRKRIQLVVSTLDEVNLSWANLLILFAIAVPMGGLAISLIKLISDIDLLAYSTMLIILSLLASQLVVFAGMRQSAKIYSPEEWQLARREPPEERKSNLTKNNTGAKKPEPITADGTDQQPPPLKADIEASDKYSNSSLSELGAQTNWPLICEYMAQQQPFLNAELKISELAEATDISIDHLSQTLNRIGSENFYQFINRYRIEHAKVLLSSSQHRKMIDIAMESGFNSQSTFYSYFKKIQKKTPSAFRTEQSKLKIGKNN